MTTNCVGLEDWIQTMFPRTKKEHLHAIYMRVAETDYIEDSLFANASAPQGSQKFLSKQMDSEAANDMMATLF